VPCNRVREKVAAHVPEDNVPRGEFVVQVFSPFQNHWQYSEQKGKNSGETQKVSGKGCQQWEISQPTKASKSIFALY
jgi:hypothetical protein